MKQSNLGKLEGVGRLTLGGGGIGQVWGETTRDEAIATVHDAYTGGINLFDMAPMYGRGEAETVMGLAFEDGYPADLRLTTKCLVGGVAPDEIEAKLIRSLDKSCARMKRDFIDLYILHGYVIPDGWQDSTRPEILSQAAVEWCNYQDHVVRTFEKLKAEGRIGGWGVTAASVQSANYAVLDADSKPDIIQAITNLLDSAGSMPISAEAADPRSVIQRASDYGVGVMGIRAVAAGALTACIDREIDPASAEAKDFERATGFRVLAEARGVSAAFLAHQYALSMPGVDTVVLGVTNRAQLYECLAAEKAGPLDAETMRLIDQSVT
jgi:aryl-alcohol dehydrogenase-like predicted oxidoreductase